MLASRSVMPVSRVWAYSSVSDEIAMQVWPASSPEPLPVGPAAPVSDSP